MTSSVFSSGVDGVEKEEKTCLMYARVAEEGIDCGAAGDGFDVRIAIPKLRRDVVGGKEVRCASIVAVCFARKKRN